MALLLLLGDEGETTGGRPPKELQLLADLGDPSGLLEALLNDP